MVTEHTISHGFFLLLTDKSKTYDKMLSVVRNDFLKEHEKKDKLIEIMRDSMNLIHA